eukprot:TRINITY_DN29145_c0_g1_i1.p1 TRINITY_DN29145_c0_g1~~TRINITY_DN29145_c0_g1_i1.p1  ORF type:complete len:416 (-),score=48.55 TRINITY_DN29145_c0_g1_i1:442-1647(-)
MSAIVHPTVHDVPNPCLEYPSKVASGTLLAGVATGFPSDQMRKVKAYQGMGASFFLADMIANEDRTVALRIFLLDNSGSTAESDGHVIQPDRTGRLQSYPATRWEEIMTSALDQARWNATAGVRCEFWLLNPPCPDNPEEGRDYVVVDPKFGSPEIQVESLNRVLRSNGPRGVTPMAMRLAQLRRRLQEQVTPGKRILFSIMTDGLPTSPNCGKTYDKDKTQFVNELRRLTAEFNLFVVIRLATDEDAVVDYYNKIDEEMELPLDILDDLKGEADEVRECGNGWFVYTPLLHRLREGGLFENIFDLLDERALKTPEIAKLMELLFRGPDDEPFPRNPKELFDLARQINSRCEPVFDVRRQVYGPPLNLHLLEKALGTKSRRGLMNSFFRVLTCSTKMPSKE